MQRTVKRLPPLTIVDLFDANMGRGQVDVLWAKLKDLTAACMQDGAKTLARVWEAAWRAGGGEDQAQGGKFDQGDLRRLYEDSKFLPSYELQNVTLDPNDRIVPTSGAATTSPRPTASGAKAKQKRNLRRLPIEEPSAPTAGPAPKRKKGNAKPNARKKRHRR